jgi:hypothetical protein
MHGLRVRRPTVTGIGAGRTNPIGTPYDCGQHGRHAQSYDTAPAYHGIWPRSLFAFYAGANRLYRTWSIFRTLYV